MVFFKRALLIGLLFCCFHTAKGSDFDPSTSKNTVVVNLNFSCLLQQKSRIYSPPEDAKFFSEIGAYYPEAEFTDDDAFNKEYILRYIEDLVQRDEVKYVLLNYSGHGQYIPLIKDGKWDGRSKEWAIQLNSSRDLRKGMHIYSRIRFLNYQIEGMIEHFKSVPPLRKSYYIAFTNMVKEREDLKTELLTIPWKDHFIGISELVYAFRAKHVAGFVDACFSGALQDFADQRPDLGTHILCSSDQDSPSDDYYVDHEGQKEAFTQRKKAITIMKKIYTLFVGKNSLSSTEKYYLTWYPSFAPYDLENRTSQFEKFQKLYTEYWNIQDSISSDPTDYIFDQIDGGPLVHYYAHPKTRKLDENGDEYLSFRELSQGLPHSFMQSPYSERVRPYYTQSKCNVSENIVIPSELFKKLKDNKRPFSFLKE